MGGNRALRDLHPGARFACHELDRRWVESNEALVAENYLWHEAYGFDEPDEAGRAELRASCGGDAPIDTGLRGGETIRLGDGWRVEVLHLPGHTFGHLGIWDPRSRAAIVIDAVLERGIYGRDGALLIPPRVYDLDRLPRDDPAPPRTRARPAPDRPLPGDGRGRRPVTSSTARSPSPHEVEAAVRDELAAGTTGLWPLTQRLDERFGPYPEFPNELGALVRSAVAISR